MKNKENVISYRGVNTNLSYFILRKIIGYSGLLLPLLCWAITRQCETSISYYYYTRSGVVFTSILTLCGVFLISYRGEEEDKERLSTNIITWIAGGFLILVAFVPTPFGENCPEDCSPTAFFHCSNALGLVHFVSAVIFFVCMGYISIFRFRGKKKAEKLPKKIRHIIYLVCGIMMWVVLVFAGFMIYIIKINLDGHFIFWIEVVLLFFFGISWLVKGKALVDFGLQAEDNEP